MKASDAPVSLIGLFIAGALLFAAEARAQDLNTRSEKNNDKSTADHPVLMKSSGYAMGRIQIRNAGSPHIGPIASLHETQSASLGRLWLGGLLGWGGGLVGGILAGGMADPLPPEIMIPSPSEGMLVGGVAGSALGTPLGTYLANSRRGNYVKATLLSAGAQGLLTLVLYGVFGDGGIAAALLASPAVETGVSVTVLRANL